MRKKIKNIATSGIVSTLLFISSNAALAQNLPVKTPTTSRNSTSAQESEYISDSELTSPEGASALLAIDAQESLQSDSKVLLAEQGFSASQIQKLSRGSGKSYGGYDEDDY